MHQLLKKKIWLWIIQSDCFESPGLHNLLYIEIPWTNFLIRCIYWIEICIILTFSVIVML